MREKIELIFQVGCIIYSKEMPRIQRAERIELTAIFENVKSPNTTDIYEVELPKHGDPRVFIKTHGKLGYRLESVPGMVLLRIILAKSVKSVKIYKYIVLSNSDPVLSQPGFDEKYNIVKWDDARIFQICITLYNGKRILVKNHSRYHTDVACTDMMMFTPHSDFFKENDRGEFVQRPTIKYIVVKREYKGNYVKEVNYNYIPITSKGEKELFEKGEHLRHICIQPWTETQHPKCVDDDPEMNELLSAFLLGYRRMVSEEAGYDCDLIESFETRVSIIWYSYLVHEKTHGKDFDIYYEYEKKSEIKRDDNIFKNDTPYSAGIFRSLCVPYRME